MFRLCKRGTTIFKRTTKTNKLSNVEKDEFLEEILKESISKKTIDLETSLIPKIKEELELDDLPLTDLDEEIHEVVKNQHVHLENVMKKEIKKAKKKVKATFKPKDETNEERRNREISDLLDKYPSLKRFEYPFNENIPSKTVCKCKLNFH